MVERFKPKNQLRLKLIRKQEDRILTWEKWREQNKEIRKMRNWKMIGWQNYENKYEVLGPILDDNNDDNK